MTKPAKGYLAGNRVILKFAGLDPTIHNDKKWKCLYFVWYLLIVLFLMLAAIDCILTTVFCSNTDHNLVERSFVIVYGGK